MNALGQSITSTFCIWALGRKSRNILRMLSDFKHIDALSYVNPQLENIYMEIGAVRTHEILMRSIHTKMAH